MTDPELLQALDYILNRSDASSIEALAEAVVRRRRDLPFLNSIGEIPDARQMAKEMTKKINAGIGGGIESLKNSVREMIVRILREQAPELSDSQIEELCNAWLPGEDGEKKETLPGDMLLSMIEQFVSFSRGTMKESVDKSLRQEMDAWPQRYWKVFPPVIRQLISDFLKDKITEQDFNSKIKLVSCNIQKTQ